MPHVHQSEVKASPLKTIPTIMLLRLLNIILLLRLLNTRLLMMILILMLLKGIKLIQLRLRLLKMIGLILRLLIRLIILLILCRVHCLGWTDGPVCDVDPPAASTLASLVPPPLPRPAIGGRNACFSLRALPVGAGLPALSLSLLS